MQETFDFRIPEDYARQLLQNSDGVRLGISTRKIEVSGSDPLFAKIRVIESEFRERGESFVLGWKVCRKYTKSELQAAEAFLVQTKHVFEPAGEECGTDYDDSIACEFCGAGAKRQSPLILDAKRLPKQAGLAFARTIAGEDIVSARFVELFRSQRFKGAEFQPVMQQSNPERAIPDWSEPVMTSKTLNIVAPTRSGINVFDSVSEVVVRRDSNIDLAALNIDRSWCDNNGIYRCPQGHTIGLNLLSELSVKRTDFADSDIAYTTQHVGVRRGLLRPETLLVISARLWRQVREHRFTGVEFEIVHLR